MKTNENCEEIITGSDGEKIEDDILNEHCQFRMRMLVQDRPYCDDDSKDGLLVRKNWYDMGSDNNCVVSRYIDLRSDCMIDHHTIRFEEEDKNEIQNKDFYHTIVGTDFNRWEYQITDEQRSWYDRMREIQSKNKDYSGLDMENFFQIINQPDFDIEGYLISKQICYDTEKEDLNTKTRIQLGKRFEELMVEN